MHVEREIIKPNFAIFLDIDGVFNRDGTLIHRINQIVKEKLNGDDYHANHCKGCITCKKAEAYCFEKSAIACFEELIEKMSNLATIHIIISSSWRVNRTLDQLIEILSMYRFSRFIIDKTSENFEDFQNRKQYCHFPHFDSVYSIPIDKAAKINSCRQVSTVDNLVDESTPCVLKCRASEINEWLLQHPGYIGFLVIDDVDNHLSQNFGEKFISTLHRGQYLFNSENCERAYFIFQKILSEKEESSHLA